MHTRLFEHVLAMLPERGDVLDFGCGDGRLLGGLAVRRGTDTGLTGLDAIEKAVSRARANYPGIRFEHERFVDKLPFEDDSFDWVVSVDTLECILDQQVLLREFARVLRPGGQILCSHWDWDTLVWASAHKDAVRRLVHSFCDWQQGWMDASDGQTGRRLWRVFQSSGLFTGKIEALTVCETEFVSGQYGYNRLHDFADLVKLGRANADEYQAVLTEQQQLATQGQYFFSLTAYLYLGMRA